MYRLHSNRQLRRTGCKHAPSVRSALSGDMQRFEVVTLVDIDTLQRQLNS